MAPNANSQAAKDRWLLWKWGSQMARLLVGSSGIKQVQLWAIPRLCGSHVKKSALASLWKTSLALWTTLPLSQPMKRIRFKMGRLVWTEVWVPAKSSKSWAPKTRSHGLSSPKHLATQIVWTRSLQSTPLILRAWMKLMTLWASTLLWANSTFFRLTLTSSSSSLMCSNLSRRSSSRTIHRLITHRVAADSSNESSATV